MWNAIDFARCGSEQTRIRSDAQSCPMTEEKDRASFPQLDAYWHAANYLSAGQIYL